MSRIMNESWWDYFVRRLWYRVYGKRRTSEITVIMEPAPGRRAVLSDVMKQKLAKEAEKDA